MPTAVPTRRLVLALGAALAIAPSLSAQTGTRIETPPDRAVLRVCADPNNLPYTDDQLEGFENRIAALLAEELGLTVQYTWWPQRRGFIRNTLRENLCDVVMGVPSTYDILLTSRPYYRSSYVFVYREDRGYDIRSLDDPALRDLTIGVHLIGDDYTNSPPAHALGKRGLGDNLRGYTVYGNYADPHPPSRLVDAVADEEVDLAVVWGPIAGYFAQQTDVPLELVPVTPTVDLPFLPFVYDISLGVRRGDDAFLARLEQALVDREDDIRRILEEYGVPMIEDARSRRPR